MPSKQEVLEKIAAALNEKTGGQRACPICGQSTWVLGDKFAVIVVGDDPQSIMLGGPSMPLAPLVCTHCGNTQFINLRVLGFSDLTALKIDGDTDVGK